MILIVQALVMVIRTLSKHHNRALTGHEPWPLDILLHDCLTHAPKISKCLSFVVNRRQVAGRLDNLAAIDLEAR